MNCLFCGGELGWDNDFTREEYYMDGDEEANVHVYTCTKCGREYVIADPPKEERETTYKEYWL